MAKILTDQELGEIIWKATHDITVIDDGSAYEHFLTDLAELTCHHFGGEFGGVSAEDDEMPYTVSIYIDGRVPSDGGIYAEYDTDVEWLGGEEI